MDRVIVCVKPVPDPQAWDRLRLDPVTKTLIREGIPSVINPLDRHALEAALEIKDAHAAEVVILAMAPAAAQPVLREALSLGADRAVLLSDRAFAGSDTLATSRILAAAIRRLQPFDLICCGNFTLDGSTAQVPSQIAEILGIPNIMHVSQMTLEGDKRLLVTQKIEQGYVRLEAEPPLLLSFTKEANKPRLGSFLEILAAEKRELALWTNADLNLEEALIGLKGSPTQMADLLVRQKKRQGLRLEGSPAEMAQQLADKIHRLGLI
ncbi:MAG: electron transfer flavoprotein subunit beta/FixA family protein [Syntrophales bacterium]|nr:electron transfer flavoprotein subunit beta/FixA family protein [Syntrophales bacterium]MDD5640584.1 electron transfer flavoprotein subunit beta/FixA family protein [Syntrophales bacterium]